MITTTMKIGDVIKVHLPGESLWAEVTDIRRRKVHARLRNESIHAVFSYGDRVVLGPDNYEVVHPAHKVETAQEAVSAWRAAQ